MLPTFNDIKLALEEYTGLDLENLNTLSHIQETGFGSFQIFLINGEQYGAYINHNDLITIFKYAWHKTI